MNLRPRSRIRNKIARWLHKALNRAENESNGNFATNGEQAFLVSLFRDKASGRIVIFDVGAHTGEWGNIAYNVLLGEDRARVSLHSFEPLAEFKGQGTLVKSAVSDFDGTLTMYKRKDDDISSVARQEWLDRKHGAAEELTVPAIRLDTYIKENRITHIDLLKIDVEGHELSVF